MKDNLLYKRCTKLEKENKELKDKIDKATECIKDFLCTEEYNKVDGKAIADNYMEVLNILGGSDE